MECDRLIKLVKSWYMQVQDEALAPARMVSFMEKHIAECNTCLLDLKVRQEVAKITEIVLPPTKVRVGKKETDEDIEEGSEEDEVSSDEIEDEETEDKVEEEEEDEILLDDEDDI
ncbi:MAG: hypothetical protein A2511_13900 [Deltaproteobacteria bacterium RIFOXYD12_FULL_50_9]|nr:MAG: hypothetical protein A2511_13900 [Deltaproteobacteria bacterium RIFOXYD12_FULL_50_9]